MEQYTAKYFMKTKKIIEKHRPKSTVLLQFFQRKDNAILCGIKEALNFLEKNTDTSKYLIKYLPEGSQINAGDVVLELEGYYPEFGLYEGMIDGILSRATSLASNANAVIEVANGKPVIFMGDRSDHYTNQERDGYAISVGGIDIQVTDAQIKNHNGKAVGTVPHALIQMFDGDIVTALRAYKDTFPEEKLTALVDFNNDVITDSLKALREFGEDLNAIRVDTSANMSDAMFLNDEEYGVTPNMITTLRNILDKNNGQHVKIIVSSGFNVQKIKEFESKSAPVDIYGVGASLLQINNTFTADAVKINGKPLAKKGRAYKESDKLVKYK